MAFAIVNCIGMLLGWVLNLHYELRTHSILTSGEEMTKTLKISVLTFCILGMLSAHAQSDSPLHKAIDNILDNRTLSGTLVSTGFKYIIVGSAITGVGAMIDLINAPRALSLNTVRLGSGVAVGAAVIILAGVLIAVVEPSSAKAATLREYFLTPEGFQMFISMPPDQMEFYASRSERLTNLVLQVSNGIDQVRASGRLN